MLRTYTFGGEEIHINASKKILEAIEKKLQVKHYAQAPDDVIKNIDILIDKKFEHPYNNVVKDCVRSIILEMSKAMISHPTFPVDIVHIAAVISEEAGEVVRAANHVYEKDGSVWNVEGEMYQAAGTCIRAMAAIRMNKYSKVDSRK